MRAGRSASRLACGMALCAAATVTATAASPPGPTPAPAGEGRVYTAYRSFWPEPETTAAFGAMGIDTRCFFAANSINSLGFEYCKYPPVWIGIRKYDFDALDRQVADLLAANPEARFLCLIDLNTPYWLTRRLAYDSFSEISHAASEPRWIEMTTRWLLDFLAHAERRHGDRIDAYILSGGGTSEWYEYDRGRSSRVKNAAWREWCARRGLALGDDAPPEGALREARHENVVYDPATEPEKIEYWRFHNGVIADAILHFAREARPRIARERELGVFFGYYMVSDNKLVSFGHLDYERVFASPDLDFFISPGTYNDRMIGGGSGPQLVLGTASRLGKRYLHEIDHRTHLVGGDNAWANQAEDDAGHKREAAFALVHHASLWWFDMWGGWYAAPETRRLICRLKEVSDRYAGDRSPSVAQALLVADPQSACYVNEKMPHASAMARGFRDKLNRTGAPFDVYSFNDLAAIDLSRYRIVFLPATLLITPERARMLRERVLTGGRTIVWVYAPGICDGKTLDVARVRQWSGSDYGTPGPATVSMGDWKSVYAFDHATMTPATLKAAMRAAGVHMYTEGQEPVYANRRLLAIHTREGGEIRVALPGRCARVIDAVSGETVARDASSFLHRFATPDTVLFEIAE